MRDQTSVEGTADTSDFAGCDQEPIQTPGNIQPYGALFVLDPTDQRIVQAGIGDPAIAASVGTPLNKTLAEIFPSAASLFQGLPNRLPTAGPAHFGLIHLSSDRTYHVIAHRSGEAVIVELEQAVEQEPASFDEIYPHVRDFLDQLRRTTTIEELTNLAAREVRRLTGLDRALVYHFDEDWNGAVISEDRNEELPAYFDLRFPASDIPAQARALYRINRLRLIADANYEAAPILPALNPRTQKPIDLSHAVLRSVSPVHLQYMRNMGTMASMSISLLRGDRLWGLISCHNRLPHRVPYHVRTACDFIGQVLSIELAARDATALADRRISLRKVQTRLLAHMAAADHFIDGLLSHPNDLLALTNAAGVAVVAGGACTLLGETPSEKETRQLVEWLGAQRRADLFVTDNLASLFAGGEAMKDRASGVLALSISQIYDSYVLWFRPEVIRTVTWGGDPRKRPEIETTGLKLHPRKSFENWRETVRLRSHPWHQAEIDAASELRTAVVDIVLRKAEELAALSERLVAINKELEAFSYSVSHDLRAPFRHIVGYAQLLKKSEGANLSEKGNRFIDTIVESALSAGTLVDNLLSFSQMGRATIRPVGIDMNALVAEVRNEFVLDSGGQGGGPAIEWHIGQLPPTRGDPVMLRLVLQNLIDNAIKFSRGRNPPIIEIASETNGDEIVYRVGDNGTGFDMAYVGKLFGVFQRLHRVEEFEGTGIGLANVKRVMERHGGRVWAEGQVDKGATIYFAMPKGDKVEEHDRA